MANFVYDQFIGSAGDLTGHTPDTGGAYSRNTALPNGAISLSGSGTAYISGGSVIGVSGAIYLNATTPASADYEVEALLTKLSAITNQYAGVVLRASTSANTLYGVVYNNATARWELFRLVSSAYLLLGSYSDAWSSGTRTVKLSASGTSLAVDIDGTANRITATDSMISTAGKAGLMAYIDGTSTTGIHYDTFTATQADLDETPLVVIEGNSQIAGTNNDLDEQLPLLLYNSPDVENIATGGETVANYQTDVASEFVPLVADRTGRVVVLIFDATNSLGVGGQTGQQTYDQMIELAVSYRTQYPQAIIIGSTVPYRDYQGGGGFDPDPSDINDRIDDFNTLMLANSLGRFDGVADVKALLGTDPSVYSSDLIHIDIEPYVSRVAALLARTINPFLGQPVSTGGVPRSRLINTGGL